MKLTNNSLAEAIPKSKIVNRKSSYIIPQKTNKAGGK